MKMTSQPRRLGAARRIWMWVISFLLSSTILAGCVTNHDIFNTASDNAGRIAGLTTAIFWIAAFVFVVVEALLIYVIVRYRGRPGQEAPKQIAGNVPLEVGWTAFPAVVLAVVFVLMVRAINTIVYQPPNPLQEKNDDPSKVVHVRVIGHQWWWEYQYPDFDVITANELHIPVGATIYLDVSSVDVIHSFWIPTLGPKMDAIPGQANRFWFTAEEAGRYFGQCSEFCGLQHAQMREIVIAEPLETFKTWIEGQQQPIPNDLTGVAREGLGSFELMQCGTCHAMRGTNAVGRVGPDLTHFGSRSTFAGASHENTYDNLVKWLQNPHALKPGNKMPNLLIPPSAADGLAKFLQSLK